MSLLALSSVLAALLAIVVSLTYKTADFFAKSQVLDSDALFKLADNQLRQYVVANGRLPCPDVTGDGISDDDAGGTCFNQQKGYLPYVTLGMTDRNYGYGEVPMLYGVYNDVGSSTISFTSLAQTYFPAYADKANGAQTVSTSRNTFDFCASLASLKAAPANSTGLTVSNGSSISYNVVYALAQAGTTNRDGLNAQWLRFGRTTTVNAQYDGLNGRSATRFALPQTPLSPTYDDRTFYRAASDLHDYFRCEAMNTSVSLLAESVTVQNETVDMADGNSEDVDTGVKVNLAATYIAEWELIQTFGAIAEASEQIGVSTGLLTAASASCPIPPWVTCALIPVYSISLSNAIAGEAAAITAGVLSGVHYGLQLTALMLYADLQSRTLSPVPTPAANISDIPSERMVELKDKYSTSKSSAITAYLKTQPPLPKTEAEYKAILTAASTTMAGKINDVTDATLKGILTDRLNGKTDTCNLAAAVCLAAGYTGQQVAQVDGSGKVILNPDKTPAMLTIYTKDLLPGAYSPGVMPAQDSYFQAVSQANSRQTLTATISSTSTDPAVINAQASLASANATLAAVPQADPAAALATSNGLISSYSNLLGLIANFDAKNSAYQAASTPGNLAARTSALTLLQNEMGTGPGWDPGAASVCGSSGCGWMQSPGAGYTPGTASSAPTSSSATLNAYLAANKDYQDALAYKKLKDAADAAAAAAWGDRNGFKSAVCAVQASTTFVGSTSRSDDDPSRWDVAENMLAYPSPVPGLNCTSTGAPANLSSNSASASADERAKYCPGGSAPDARLCALYGGGATPRSTVQGAEDVVNELIRRGIVK